MSDAKNHNQPHLEAHLTSDGSTSPSESALRHQKRDLRRHMTERRAEAVSQSPKASEAIRERFLSVIDLSGKKIIAVTHAHGSEIDPGPLSEALRKQGYSLCLPVTTGKSLPLVFHAYAPGDPLITGALSIQEPLDRAFVVQPDILLVPLLAFDRQGHRLGYGGGYYDRTLLELRHKKTILAVGLAFAMQEVAHVPVTSRDARLDWIITEKEAIRITDRSA